MIRRYRIQIGGIVQGVGFRPFLHRRADELGLAGWGRNTGSGVELELEGEERALNDLLSDWKRGNHLPPLAVVESVRWEERPVTGQRGFALRSSLGGGHDTLIAPDIATCPDCLRELRDPADRRFGYPFLNCTNCGPRFTIVRSVPYDRPNTAMAKFPMCPACAGEYQDINDRRYHAQPDCCPACGPKLVFADGAGNPVPGDPIALAKRLLQGDGILAVKGLGGFHLACRIEGEVVKKLRERKRRRTKPLAVMCRDAAAARRLCRIREGEAALLSGPRRPILLLDKRADDYNWLSPTDTLGVMLPYTPVHELLFDGADYDALVMTSANLCGLPAVIGNSEALAVLSRVADGFLLHDRDILRRCDDSLVRWVEGAPYFIRRSRGYVPQPITLDFDASGVLALGAEQKASFALGKRNRAFYSQHIGDLKNAETLEHYGEQIRDFEELFDARPRLLACDLHPDFLSTRYARERAGREGLPLWQVQHHHAHLCSCMADNGLTGACIGLTWDGAGLGTDGLIWGGEVLTGDVTAFRRAASLRPISLPGGDAAVVEIGRIAQSLCWDAGVRAPKGMPADRRRFVQAMLEKGVNCPRSSGVGRLFDGVYSLLTGAQTAGYEGEGAVLLETLANRAPEERGRYEVGFDRDGSGLPRWDTRPMVRALAEDSARGEAPEVLARRFHNTLISYAAAAAGLAREETGLERVVLSGGVFFNLILLRGVTAELERNGFQVYRHRRVSTGDEGIALGQLAIAAHRNENGR